MARTIAQISDLHFGRVDPIVADALARDLHALNPHLTVVSGDLTQRARRKQFIEAAAFLKRIPQPFMVVPGNHDIPLYDVLRRFISPLGRYRHYIQRDLRPHFEDDEIVVVGINTARPFTPRWNAFWKGGRISSEQLIDVKTRMCDAPRPRFKIIVTHHPFVPAPGEPDSDLVGEAPRALAMFESCGVDMVLSGHLHLSYSDDMRAYHTASKRSILSIHAGTATSNRRRGEPNTFNVITIQQDEVLVQLRAWDGNSFEPTVKTQYRRQDGIWQRER